MNRMFHAKQGLIYAEQEPRAPLPEGVPKRYLEAPERILAGSVQKPSLGLILPF